MGTDQGPRETGDHNGASDANLLSAARSGEQKAFADLWIRHRDVAYRVARATSASIDPDDVVSEAYLRIWRAIQAGSGPTETFRPYLLATVRNVAISWAKRSRDVPTDEMDEVADSRTADLPLMVAAEAQIMMAALRSLPERWQEVLWLTEVQALPPAEIAAKLDLTANSIAALSYRARAGLRQAWVQVHVERRPRDAEHEWVCNRIGQDTFDALSARDKLRYDTHIAACAACKVTATDARRASGQFTSFLLPLAVGIVATSAAVTLGDGTASPARAVQASTHRRALSRSSRQRLAVLVAIGTLTAAVGVSVAATQSPRMEPAVPSFAAPAQPAAPSMQPTPIETTRPSSAPSDEPSPPTNTLTSPPVAPTTPNNPVNDSPSLTPFSSENDAQGLSVTSVDTGGGALFPEAFGTARPSSTVRISLGSFSIPVQATEEGDWASGPMTMQPGSQDMVVTSDGLTRVVPRVALIGPTLSASRTSEEIRVAVQGAPSSTYDVRVGEQALTVLTDSQGDATARFGSAAGGGGEQVSVRAHTATRFGPETVVRLP